MMRHQYLPLLVVSLLFFSCGPTVLDERFEYSVLASLDRLSVPDTSVYNDIRVQMSFLLGRTSCYSFRTLVHQKTDTLFEFAAFATLIEQTGVPCVEKEVRLDTTVVLKLDVPRTKMHYVKVVSANGIYWDSTYVRP